MNAPLLELKAVQTHIGAYHILHGVDFAVPEGDFILLFGDPCSAKAQQKGWADQRLPQGSVGCEHPNDCGVAILPSQLHWDVEVIIRSPEHLQRAPPAALLRQP